MDAGLRVGEEVAPHAAVSGFFAVHVRSNCPHVNDGVVSASHDTLDNEAERWVASACETCGTREEPWLCCQCHSVRCGRHADGHAIAHFTSTGHPITLSFLDLSCWCYECDSYIEHANLRPLLDAVYKARFGRDHPHAAIASVQSANPDV